VESDLERTPVIIPVEAYVSADYARAEQERIWLKVWQVACREEEIPKVGDYYTYDILDQSVIVVRTAPEMISAYHNVCMHRGRRLTTGCGHTARFHCNFHGWQYDLQGRNTRLADQEDWGGALNAQNTRLQSIKVDCWAGYVFINFDPKCEPLSDYLTPVADWLNPFEIGKMRYRWRQWLYFPCNWKVAVEAFIESYHVPATHPQLTRFGTNGSWTRAHGKHSCMGVGKLDGGEKAGGGTTAISTSTGDDPRKLAADFMAHLYETVNANTTQTIVDAAKRLVDVLPEGTAPDVVMGKMMEIAAQADADRGVIWPTIDPSHFRDSGIDWHVFPNTIILHGITFILGYRARPNGFDPDSCIFEVYVLERFPEGQEPKPQNVFQPDISEDKWRLVLTQDFNNMGEVQRGVKSMAFPGMRPNPLQEQSVINFHRNLARYMGAGNPQEIG
jgi:nitrite reductase/ring-hydroxylating ferredoxin subunit